MKQRGSLQIEQRDAPDDKAQLPAEKGGPPAEDPIDPEETDEQGLAPVLERLADSVTSWLHLKEILDLLVHLRECGLRSEEGDRLSAVGINADKEWTKRPAGRALIRCLRDLFSHQRILRELHALLLAPISQALEEERKQGTEEVLIIPHKDLFSVPWAALLDTNNKYFVEHFTVRVAPSLRVASQASSGLVTRGPSSQHLASHQDGHAVRPPRKFCALVVGNPDLKDPKMELPHSEEEAKEVASKLGDACASVTTLLKERASKGAVLAAFRMKQEEQVDGMWAHLACHGDLLANALLLARNKGAEDSAQESGSLSMEEVSKEVQLQKGSTVVLSACNSGRGNIMSEGVVGLSRSFLAAGASAVVSSLWTIGDESTRKLMSVFYRRLLQGWTTPQALRLAMIELIRGKTTADQACAIVPESDRAKVAKVEPYASPINRAAFMVVGASTSLALSSASP